MCKNCLELWIIEEKVEGKGEREAKLEYLMSPKTEGAIVDEDKCTGLRKMESIE